MIEDIASIISDFGDTTFTWNGNVYPCIASITEFQRDLGDGGFALEKMVNLVVPLEGDCDVLTFPGNILPDAQQLITFQGLQYRIITKKIHPTTAYVRYVARSDTRGI